MDVARFDRSDTDVRTVYDRLVLSVKHQPLKGSVMFSGCARVVASGFALYGFPVAFAYSSFFFLFSSPMKAKFRAPSVLQFPVQVN